MFTVIFALMKFDFLSLLNLACDKNFFDNQGFLRKMGNNNNDSMTAAF